MADPPYDYTPKDPSKYIQTIPLEISYKTAAEEVGRHNETTLATSLTNLFKVGHGRANTDSEVLQSTTITTRSIDGVVDAFDSLMADAEVKEQVTRILRKNHGKAYMITSVKTFVDADINTIRGRAREYNAKLNVPVSSIVSSGALPIDIMDPSVGAKIVKSTHWKTSHVAEGEQIYAIQYRLVEREGSWRWKKEPEYTVGTTERHAFGTFHPGSATEEDRIIVSEEAVQACDLSEEGWEESETEDSDEYLYRSA
jgi:hypothetical protein